MTLVKPADIFFVMHHGTWLSRAIAWFMGSRWSHSGLIVEQGKYMHTLETTSFQVSGQFFDDYLNDPNCSLEVWRCNSLTDDQRWAVIANAMVHNEKMYGYVQLFSLGVRRLFMRAGIKIKNFLRGGLVCTHVVTYGYSGLGVPGLFDIEPESIDTEELYQMVRAGDFKLVMARGR